MSWLIPMWQVYLIGIGIAIFLYLCFRYGNKKMLWDIGKGWEG